MAGRIIVVGDIHGCFDELDALLSKLALTADDRLYCVGDLIVKGPKNRQVLDLFISDKRFSAVLGNHDLMVLRYLQHRKFFRGKADRKCAKELKESRKKYKSYLSSLPLTIDLGSHAIVHAGVRPGISLENQSTKDLTELRTLGGDRTSKKGTPWYEVYDGPKTILFGHWPQEQIRRGKKAIGLDTGCVFGSKLTAYIVEADTFVSVN